MDLELRTRINRGGLIEFFVFYLSFISRYCAIGHIRVLVDYVVSLISTSPKRSNAIGTRRN